MLADLQSAVDRRSEVEITAAMREVEELVFGALEDDVFVSDVVPVAELCAASGWE